MSTQKKHRYPVNVGRKIIMKSTVKGNEFTFTFDKIFIESDTELQFSNIKDLDGRTLELVGIESVGTLKKRHIPVFRIMEEK